MARKKSSGGSKFAPMKGGDSAIKANPGIPVPSLVGAKITAKPRKSKGGKRTLKTHAGRSGIMNLPTGGGYNG